MTRPDDGCPWCGQTGDSMKRDAGVATFDAALEAHVAECAPYLREQGSPDAATSD